MNELEALWHWLLRGLGIEDADPAPATPLQLPPGPLAPPPRITQAPGGPLTILSPVAPGDVRVVDDDPIVAPAYKFLTSPAWGAPERAALRALQVGLGLDPSDGGLVGVIQHETGGVPNLPTDAQIAAERARPGSLGGKSTPRGGLTQITVGAHVPGYDTAEKVRAIRAMPITAQLAAGGPIDLYWRGQMPRGPGADQSTRHLLRLNFLPALASAPASTVLGVAAGKVGPGGEKPEDVIPGGLTKGAIYAANPVFDGPKRGWFTWADVDGQVSVPPGWVTVSGRVLSTLPAERPAPDMGAGRSAHPYVRPLGETTSQAHASGQWMIEHAMGHHVSPAGPGAADLGAGASSDPGSTPDVTSVTAALDGSATVEPPASPISVAQCARGLVLPPISNVTPWQGPVPAWLQTWATAHLVHEIGTVVRDTVGGVPVVGRVECHSYYGADPSKPSAPHKGVTLYQPTATASPPATPPTQPASAKARKSGGGKASKAPATPTKPDADAPAPEDAPSAPAPADPAPDAPPAEGLQDPPEDEQLLNGLRASASATGVDMGDATSPDARAAIEAILGGSSPDMGTAHAAPRAAAPSARRTTTLPQSATETQAPGKVQSLHAGKHDPPPGSILKYGLLQPAPGNTTPPSVGAVWNDKIGHWVDGPGSQPYVAPGSPTAPSTSGPTAPTLHRGANGQWLDASGNPVSVTGGPAAPPNGGAAPPGYANGGGGRWGSSPDGGGGGYSPPPNYGVDPSTFLDLLQAVQQSPVSDAPTYSGGLDPSDVLAILAQQQQAGAVAPDLAATLQGYLDQGGDPSALAALLQGQAAPDASPDMGAALSRRFADLGLALDRDYVDPLGIIRRGIVPAWLEGSVDPVTWVPLNVSGYQLQVMAEPASVRGIRLPTSLDALVRMGAAVEGGAIPITPAISDARWQQAAERIPGAEWHTTDPRGATGEPKQVVAFNAHLPPPSTVLRDGYGKEFVLTPELKPEGAGSGIQYGWRWPDGRTVQKGTGGPHNRAHGDYSDLGTLVKLGALDPQGNPVNLLDVLTQDSALSPALKPWLIERLRAAVSPGGVGV